MPMQSTERDEFSALIRKLMGAHDVFPNPDKIDAYWDAFSPKLSLLQVSRLIDYALSEHGPEEMPTVPEMWGLYRELRNPVPRPAPDAIPEPSGPTIQAQLCAYATLTQRLSPTERARPWEYRFREWWMEGKQQVELSAVHILRDDGHTTRVTVLDMRADQEGHARALKSFKPGPLPPQPARSVLTEAAPIEQAVWDALTPAQPDFSDAPAW